MLYNYREIAKEEKNILIDNLIQDTDVLMKQAFKDNEFMLYKKHLNCEFLRYFLYEIINSAFKSTDFLSFRFDAENNTYHISEIMGENVDDVLLLKYVKAFNKSIIKIMKKIKNTIKKNDPAYVYCVNENYDYYNNFKMCFINFENKHKRNTYIEHNLSIYN